MSKHLLITRTRAVLAVAVLSVVLLLAVGTRSAMFGQAAQCGKLLKSSTSEFFIGGIHIDGTVWMWGNNNYGQLGDNTRSNKSLAVLVLKGNQYNGTNFLGDNSSNPVVEGAAGNFHTIVMTLDGAIYAWGNNTNGELGLNSTSPSESSLPVRPLKGQYPGTTYIGDASGNKVTSLSAASHNMALTESGLVYTWGEGSDGQIGDNGFSQRTSPVKVRKGDYSGTTYLGDNTANPVVAVAASRVNSFALTSQGQVFAWGSSDHGQIGNNATTATAVPVRVRKGQYSGTTYLGDASGNKVVQIAGNWSSGYAMTERGEIYAWGFNNYGQLGDNTNTDRYTPIRVKKGQYNGTTYLGDNSSNPIVKIFAVEKVFVGLAQDGTPYVMGRNDHGQLGDNTINQRSTPIRVLKGDCYDGTSYLGDNSNFQVIDVSGTGSVGTGSMVYQTSSDCKLYATGLDTYGQLSDSTLTDERHTVCQIKANSNGICGNLLTTSSSNGSLGLISPDGTIFMWGVNSCDQLGDNSGADQPKPVKVVHGQYSGTQYLGDKWDNPVVEASTGDNHTVAVVKTGVVYTWGCGSNGELGKGTTTGSATPVRVLKGQYSGTTYLGDASGNKVTLVRAAQHTLALTESGSVYAWGYNANGQLGNNTTNNATSPVRSLKGQYSGTQYLGDNSSNPVKDVSAGLYNSSVIDNGGTVYSWGDNAFGQVGDATTTARLTPVKTLKGQYSGTTYLGDNASNPAVQVCSGKEATVALMADGSVYSWGNNGWGTLGNGTTTNSNAPVRVLKGQYNGSTYLGDDSNNKIVKLALVNRSVAAIAADGSIYTWGNNNAGQLGDNTTNNRTSPVRVLKGSYSGTTYLGDNGSDKVTNVSGVGLGDTDSGNQLIFMTNTCKVYKSGNGSNTPSLVGPFNTDISLPVELTSFTALLQGDNVDLRWTTASEINSYAIEVERRIGTSGAWTSVGAPIPGHGTTSQSHDYNSTDNVSVLRSQAPATLYYRLRFVDLDGSFTNSEIREVKILPRNAAISFVVTPNPITTGSDLNLVYNLTEQSEVVLSLYNPMGQLVNTVVKGQQDAGEHTYRFTNRELQVLTNTASGGTYFWRLEVNGTAYTQQVVVTR